MRRWPTALLVLPLLLLVVPGIGVASMRSEVAKGNRLYHQGKYKDAIQQYGEALVNNPDSPIAHFNMAAAQYKAGEFADAIAALQKVDTAGDKKLSEQVAYNLGNAYFRLGEQSADKKPQSAIVAYQQALTSYKHAMAANPNDTRPKFNHEFVQAKLKQLKKRLEEEKKQQQNAPKKKGQPNQQKKQNQQQSQQQKNQQQKNQQQKQQQQQAQKQKQGQQQAQKQQAQKQAGQQKKQEQQQAQSSSAQQKTQQEQQQQAAAAETAEQKDKKEQDRQQAQAIIDTAREEELRPDQVNRHMGTAVVGQPLEDW